MVAGRDDGGVDEGEWRGREEEEEGEEEEEKEGMGE